MRLVEPGLGTPRGSHADQIVRPDRTPDIARDTAGIDKAFAGIRDKLQVIADRAGLELGRPRPRERSIQSSQIDRIDRTAEAEAVAQHLRERAVVERGIERSRHVRDEFQRVPSGVLAAWHGEVADRSACRNRPEPSCRRLRKGDPQSHDDIEVDRDTRIEPAFQPDADAQHFRARRGDAAGIAIIGEIDRDRQGAGAAVEDDHRIQPPHTVGGKCEIAPVDAETVQAPAHPIMCEGGQGRGQLPLCDAAPIEKPSAQALLRKRPGQVDQRDRTVLAAHDPDAVQFTTAENAPILRGGRL
ncbi:MAG: hypothetical protein WDN24_19400 [Sphingomonas sp.]